MRLIWLSVIALACIGTVFLFRNSLRAHAEKYPVAIEEGVRSNVEAKGDRLDLYRPSLPQPTTITPPADPAPPALAAPAKPEFSKPVETISWHWREGAKTIIKISSNGEKTQLLRDKARQVRLVQKQKSGPLNDMSALHPTADIVRPPQQVR